ncbi:MAG: hypothetical protein HUJ86_01870 [Synergistes sp.]|nr:hypothetical protein [Synergistes sp.]
MEITKKLAMLEEVMELDEGTLKPEMLLEEIEEYDSLAKLGLIVLMSDEFSKQLSYDGIMQFKTVQDILDYMD